MKRTQLAQKLSLEPAQPSRKLSSFLIGFDGFTDEIVTAVDSRTSPSHFVPMTHLSQFATRVQEAMGKSCNIELVRKAVKIGGNGPILAQALIEAGFQPTLIGCLGEKEIEPLFQPLVTRCKAVFSLAGSGHTDAIEFLDGKLMLGKHESILTLTKELIEEKVERKKLIALFDDADVVVSVNWTMIPQMTDIWQWLISDIFPHLSPRRRLFFVDLADPAKRSDSELLTALDTLSHIQKGNQFEVHLGVNQKEAERLLVCLQKDQKLPHGGKLQQMELLAKAAELLQQATDLDCVIIHTTKQASASTADTSSCIEGPYCPTPYISTGGGDNFNAGYLLGAALSLPLEERLLLGTATSGFYIRAGKSPSLNELSQFLRTWDRDPSVLDTLCSVDTF